MPLLPDKPFYGRLPAELAFSDPIRMADIVESEIERRVAAGSDYDFRSMREAVAQLRTIAYARN